MSTVESAPNISLFNLPNKLTSLRLLLAFVLFTTIWINQWVLSLVIFVIAAFTDWLDGYFARKRGLVSSLGRVYDPLVDKVLVCGAFVFLMEDHRTGLNAWMVTVIIAREFIVTGLRGFLEERGVSFGADQLGKIKMCLQCLAIATMLVVLSLADRGVTSGGLYLWQGIVNWGTVIVTFVSGANYVQKAIKHLS